MRQLLLLLILTRSASGYAQLTSREGTLSKKNSDATFNDPCDESKQAAITTAKK